ncbi:integrin beta-8-like isoform X2 [Denticeps clupeoides]|uniref:integrin beta-8-like isoform X2 n=1 Tax=Denticeps clupeoides TaxID=299321 RepID=UPI0010A3B4C2|nr:integrin beta-8-like isoform X2 [Denticeps clupeoides]
MTSWRREPLVPALLSVLIGVIASAEDHCASSALVSTCPECLSRGPACAWCYQEDFLDGAHASQRCDSAANLLRKGCSENMMANPQVRVEVNATLSSSQVAPRDVSLHLRPGAESSFVVEVQQLERYPVDLYYLVDVSASMQDNLDRLKSVGVALSHSMREYSSDFRVGFGSFVDKPVSPYINVHPSKIQNPCSDYEVQCRPAHGFIHVLRVTENVTELTRVIDQQRISGNMDTPEGTFDAMLQAVVCQKDIGWRPEAKHLLLVMTDQPSHLALDSKLAGIVVPHDGKCHLEGNTYVQTANMEHPTIGQLAEKLLENNIYSIFAVDQVQYKWYEDLVDLLPGTYLGRLLPKASNLKDLVVEAYKNLLSDVAVEVTMDSAHVQRFWVNVATVCPDGSSRAGSSRCSNVQPGQTVFFNVTVGMTSCPADDVDEDVLLTVQPVGFNESVAVRVKQTCGCDCGLAGRCHDNGESGSCGAADEEARLAGHRQCQAEGSGTVCSGRGSCVCGMCVCHHGNLGAVYGKFCELDDFSCPYQDGLLCGGRGQCVLGECRCQTGWTGESCGCPISAETCRSNDGILCSGHGRCVCGSCVCDEPQRSGRLCDKCPTCYSSCQTHWMCVNCHLSYGLGQGSSKCNRTCSPLVDYVDDITVQVGGADEPCLYPSTHRCHYRFQMGRSQGKGVPQLLISRHPDCLPSQRYFVTFLSVFLLTVVLGLGILAVLRILLRRRDWPNMPGRAETFDRNNKDLSFIPTANEKTITYRRDGPSDRPLEMHFQGQKIPLSEVWQ